MLAPSFTAKAMNSRRCSTIDTSRNGIPKPSRFDDRESVNDVSEQVSPMSPVYTRPTKGEGAFATLSREPRLTVLALLDHRHLHYNERRFVLFTSSRQSSRHIHVRISR